MSSAKRMVPSSASVPDTAITSSNRRSSTRSETSRSFNTSTGKTPLVSSNSTRQWPLVVDRMSLTMPTMAASLPPGIEASALVGRWLTRPRSCAARRSYRSRNTDTKSWYSPVPVDAPVMSPSISTLRASAVAARPPSWLGGVSVADGSVCVVASSGGVDAGADVCAALEAVWASSTARTSLTVSVAASAAAAATARSTAAPGSSAPASSVTASRSALYPRLVNSRTTRTDGSNGTPDSKARRGDKHGEMTAGRYRNRREGNVETRYDRTGMQ